MNSITLDTALLMQYIENKNKLDVRKEIIDKFTVNNKLPLSSFLILFDSLKQYLTNTSNLATKIRCQSTIFEAFSLLNIDDIDQLAVIGTILRLLKFIQDPGFLNRGGAHLICVLYMTLFDKVIATDYHINHKLTTEFFNTNKFQEICCDSATLHTILNDYKLRSDFNFNQAIFYVILGNSKFSDCTSIVKQHLAVILWIASCFINKTFVDALQLQLFEKIVAIQTTDDSCLNRAIYLYIINKLCSYKPMIDKLTLVLPPQNYFNWVVFNNLKSDNASSNITTNLSVNERSIYDLKKKLASSILSLIPYNRLHDYDFYSNMLHSELRSFLIATAVDIDLVSYIVSYIDNSILSFCEGYIATNMSLENTNDHELKNSVQQVCTVLTYLIPTTTSSATHIFTSLIEIYLLVAFENVSGMFDSVLSEILKVFLLSYNFFLTTVNDEQIEDVAAKLQPLTDALGDRIDKIEAQTTINSHNSLVLNLLDLLLALSCNCSRSLNLCYNFYLKVVTKVISQRLQAILLVNEKDENYNSKPVDQFIHHLTESLSIASEILQFEQFTKKLAGRSLFADQLSFPTLLQLSSLLAQHEAKCPSVSQLIGKIKALEATLTLFNENSTNGISSLIDSHIGSQKAMVKYLSCVLYCLIGDFKKTVLNLSFDDGCTLLYKHYQSRSILSRLKVLDGSSEKLSPGPIETYLPVYNFTNTLVLNKSVDSSCLQTLQNTISFVSIDSQCKDAIYSYFKLALTSISSEKMFRAIFFLLELVPTKLQVDFLLSNDISRQLSLRKIYEGDLTNFSLIYVLTETYFRTRDSGVVFHDVMMIITEHLEFQRVVDMLRESFMTSEHENHEILYEYLLLAEDLYFDYVKSPRVSTLLKMLILSIAFFNGTSKYEIKTIVLCIFRRLTVKILEFSDMILTLSFLVNDRYALKVPYLSWAVFEKPRKDKSGEFENKDLDDLELAHASTSSCDQSDSMSGSEFSYDISLKTAPVFDLTLNNELITDFSNLADHLSLYTSLMEEYINSYCVRSILVSLYNSMFASHTKHSSCKSCHHLLSRIETYVRDSTIVKQEDVNGQDAESSVHSDEEIVEFDNGTVVDITMSYDRVTMIYCLLRLKGLCRSVFSSARTKSLLLFMKNNCSSGRLERQLIASLLIKHTKAED